MLFLLLFRKLETSYTDLKSASFNSYPPVLALFLGAMFLKRLTSHLWEGQFSIVQGSPLR